MAAEQLAGVALMTIGGDPVDREPVVARRIGEAGVNIELAYRTFGAVRLVLGVDELDRARAAM